MTGTTEMIETTNVLATVGSRGEGAGSMNESRQGGAWVRDPDDPQQLRYFDGLRWTEHRAPNPAVPPPRIPATPEAVRRTHRARIIVGTLVAALVVFGVVALVAGKSSPEDADTTAATTSASACLAAYQAGTDYAEGQESLPVTMYALRRAEAQARQAARQVPSYKFIADNIAGLEADLSGSGDGLSLRLLSEDCGPAHG